MRWLALVALSACHFTPGAFGSQPQDGGDDGALSDVLEGDAADATEVTADTAPPGPPFVRRIDITDALVTGGPHTDFPLLVSLSDTWLASSTNGGDVARDDAFDLWFSLDQAGTTKLSHEVEVYDAVNGVLVAWVKLSLAPDSVLYVHYGDTSLTSDPTMAAAVWSNGFGAVDHLAGNGDATGQNVVSANVTAAAGKIGPARAFDGATSVVNFGSAGAIDNVFAGGGTAEAWINPASHGENDLGRVMDKSGWALLMDKADAPSGIVFGHLASSSTQGLWRTPTSSISKNTWQHVAVVYNKDDAANTPAMYVNGAPVTVTLIDTPTGPMSGDGTSTLYIGNRSGSDRTFDGLLDEARLSKSARSAGWIATEVANQSVPSAFYTVSAPL